MKIVTTIPTADALYASIREEFPNISLGTVYRNLNLLAETGEIQKADLRGRCCSL
ncbi:MAG: transcriptional repressor [Enterocloster clostridioformis]